MHCRKQHNITHGRPTFYGKGPHLLSWAGSWAAYGTVTRSDIPYCWNYCAIYIVYLSFTNVSTGRVIQPGGSHDINCLKGVVIICTAWFKIWNLCILSTPFASVCFIISHRKLIISWCSTLVLVFIMEMYCVFCEVVPVLLNMWHMKFVLQRVTVVFKVVQTILWYFICISPTTALY
jgi:hypothetical protein